MSPDGSLLAAGGVDGAVRIWDLNTRSKLETLRSDLQWRAGAEALVSSLAFSKDGRYLASGHISGGIHVWNLGTKKELDQFAFMESEAIRVRAKSFAHKEGVAALEFSPDGKTLASAGLDSRIKLWQVDTLDRGPVRFSKHRREVPVRSLAYARGGSWIVVSLARHIEIVNAATVEVLVRLDVMPLDLLRVSPDGRYLAGSATDGTVPLFDLNALAERITGGNLPATLKPEKVLAGHRKPVSGLAFFPDGTHLAGVAMSNKLILWDLRTGAGVNTLWGTGDEVFAGVAAFARDDSVQIACGLSDTRIRLWGSNE